MPSFSSKAQMRKFAELVESGQVSKAEFDERLSKTDVQNLPDRVVKKSSPGKSLLPRLRK